MTIQQVDEFIISKNIKSGYTGKPINGRFFECATGWDKIICDCIQELLDAGWDGHVSQVKEKFGGLRFYIPSGNDKMWEIIDKYENISFHVCESCGDNETAKIRGTSWYSTLCDKCAEDSGKIEYATNPF